MTNNSMEDGSLLVDFILGGIFAMLIYHVKLYYFNREKLLFQYNLYLFFTYLLVFIFSDVFYFFVGNDPFFYYQGRLKETFQILYLTFYYNFILKSLEIEKNSAINKIWKYFFLSLIIYAVIFLIYSLFWADEKSTKTIPFIISRLSMFVISLILLKKCYELRNFTFQKYILYGSTVYFFFGILAFVCSMRNKSLLGIRDVEWLFVGAIVDIIFFGLAISYRNRLKLEASLKIKILLDLEKTNNNQLTSQPLKIF